ALAVGAVVFGIGADQAVAAEKTIFRLAAASRPVSVLRDEDVPGCMAREPPQRQMGKGKGARQGDVEIARAKSGKQRRRERRVLPRGLAAKGRKGRYPLEALTAN